MRYYHLDAEHRPVATDEMGWARWYETADRRVAEDATRFHRILTVFLGLDQRRLGKGPPILFETMVFEDEATIREIFGRLRPVHEEVERWRYTSWDDALTGHKAILKRYRKAEAEALKMAAP